MTAVYPAFTLAQTSSPASTAFAPADQDHTALTASSLGISRQFARWIFKLRYEDLPPEVADRTRGCVLQGLSGLILGSQTDEGRFFTRTTIEQEAGVRNGATIGFDGTKVTAGGAAYTNAHICNAGQMVDSFRMITHPGTNIIPTALAAAELYPVSGMDFLTAVTAGYEVMERMADDYISSVAAHAVDPQSVFGIFGAATAAARIMRLTEDQINSALSFCVDFASGNSFHRARGPASRNAILAVLLAKELPPKPDSARLERHADIFHGPWFNTVEASMEANDGLYTAYLGNNRGELRYSYFGNLQASLSNITADLGQKWLILETLYRVYPISVYNNPHIEIGAQLSKEYNIQYKDIDRIEAVVNWLETLYPTPAFASRSSDAVGEPKVGTTRYYTAYGIVKRGFPFLGVGENPDPPEVLDLMKRVTIIPSHTMSLFGPRITVFMKSGKIYTKQGTGRELMWDFNEEARRIREIIPGLPIPAAQFEELIATCGSLEKLDRADKLIQLTLKRRSG